MDIRNAIETIFEGRAFLRPLFYSYPGGLRFELSRGGTAIEQFLLALRKATEICADIFPEGEPLVISLRTIAEPRPLAHRGLLRELDNAGIAIPRERSLWLEPVAVDERWDEDVEQWWVNLAFELPAHLLQNALWCAFATDMGVIRPRPFCSIYLFHLTRKIMLLPYDDRGMDVVGPNHELLARLYRKHSGYLLDYDRDDMDATFGKDGAQ